MNNEQAILMWKRYPDNKKLREMAFKAIWKNNQGGLNLAWKLTYDKLKAKGIMAPMSHKKDFFSFVKELSIEYIGNFDETLNNKFYTYYWRVIKTSVTKYVAKAAIVKQPYNFLTKEKMVDGKKVEIKYRSIRPSNTLELNGMDNNSEEERIVALKTEDEEYQGSLKAYIDDLLVEIPPKDRRIMVTYLQAHRKDGVSLRSMESKEGLTGERMRQIIRKSCKKVKNRHNLLKNSGNALHKEISDMFG